MVISGCVRMTSTTTSPPNFSRSYAQTTGSSNGTRFALASYSSKPSTPGRPSSAPLHVCNKTNTRESLLFSPPSNLVDECQCPALIEEPTLQMSLGPLA